MVEKLVEAHSRTQCLVGGQVRGMNVKLARGVFGVVAPKLVVKITSIGGGTYYRKPHWVERVAMATCVN